MVFIAVGILHDLLFFVATREEPIPTSHFFSKGGTEKTIMVYFYVLLTFDLEGQ